MAQAAGHDINYIALAGALAHFGRAGAQADAADQPRRRLRRRRHVHGVRRRVRHRSRRSASGKGQVIDAAMVDGSATLMTMMWGLKADRLLGRALGTNVLDTGAPFYDTYETTDGKFISLGSLEPQFYAELIAAARPRPTTGLPAQMDQSGWADAARRGSPSCSRRRRATSGDEILERHRRVLRAGAHDGRGGRRTSTSRRATRSSSDDGVPQPAPAPRFVARRARVQRPRAVARPAHRRGARRLGLRRRRRRQAPRVRRDRLARRRARAGRSTRVDERRAARRGAASSSVASARGDGDVADLAAGRGRLAVVVQVRARDREHRVAVGHRRRCS